jgi:hypothetical protein
VQTKNGVFGCRFFIVGRKTTVIPAKAGIHAEWAVPLPGSRTRRMDPGVRRDDVEKGVGKGS